LNTNYMKAPNATPKNNAFIKSTLIILVLLFVSLCSRAQDELAFPFKGGSEVMSKFFRDSVALTPDIIQKKATGTVIFKFSADQQGNISKHAAAYRRAEKVRPPMGDPPA
jgi:hypothetical protein